MSEGPELIPRSGAKFLCELPKSSGEWRIMPFTGQDGKTRMIVINPEHPPYVLEDGTARLLVFDANPSR